MPTNKTVVIIGAGIMGCALAFELGKAGYSVQVVDKAPNVAFGSTSSSSAIIRAHYTNRQSVMMAYEGFAYWENWSDYLGVEDELGHARFIQSGTILFRTEAYKFDRILELYRELGIPHEEWDVATLQAKMPFYAYDAFYPPTRPDDDAFWEDPNNLLESALWSPKSGYMNSPQLAAHNLMRAAQAYGATFTYNAEVVAIRQQHNQVQGITLKDGREIDASIVINAGGPHSNIINEMAGVLDSMNIKTRALRHEVHHLEAPKDLDFEKAGCHTTDGDLGIYWRPEAGNTILIGSEDPPCDEMEWIDDPDNFNRDVTEAQWKAQVYRFAKRFPSIGVPSQRRGIADLYDVSDDWIPIYDKSDLGGYYMAIGTNGNQFKNAPVVGYVMTQLIDACENGHDHDADPLQIRTLYRDFELDMGFFSRRREFDPNTSQGVNG